MQPMKMRPPPAARSTYRRLGRMRWVAGLCLLAIAAAGGALASTGSGSSPGMLEMNMTHTNTRSSGEPEIAQSPVHPNDMVYVSTYYKYSQIAGMDSPYSVVGPGEVEGYEYCFVAWSIDGGKTWTPGQWPNGDRPYCGDPMVSVDRAGTFYISMDWMGNSATPDIPAGDNQGIDGDIGVISSLDGGRTWSVYGHPGDTEPVTTATGVDRPFTRVDPVTGIVYVESGFTGRTLSYSTDHGATWSTPVNFPGNHIAAYDGVVATAVQGGSTCAAGGFACAPSVGPTQFTFYASTDRGQSFTSYPVKDSRGDPVTGGTGDWISADPTHPGRFAVMQQDASGNSYDVYIADVTSGAVRFTGPARLESPAGAPSGLTKPWMDFGSQGLLGVMWKTTDTNDFDVYAAVAHVSAQNSATFSAPLKVASSAAEDANRGDGGDDLSWISIYGNYAYIGWGGVDQTLSVADSSAPGALNGYYARIPLTDFNA